MNCEIPQFLLLIARPSICSQEHSLSALRNTPAQSKSGSFAPFLLPHFCSPLNFGEPKYKNEITKQLELTPDLCCPECTPCLA